MQERRKHPRVLTVLAVKYKKEKEATPYSCTSRDISLGGVGLTVSEAFTPGELVELEIELPRQSSPLFLKGKIVWSFVNKRSKDTEKISYRVGVMFTEIPEETRKRLKEYIQLLFSKPGKLY
ncbi:MAG: PilZ domain-containing protein [Candidatus Omnitrophota bacterium]